jgi:site-specific DNA recombinase
VVLAAFCGMSKSERRRIQLRVRSAMEVQATDGRFLGGRPPYGYRLVNTDTPHPNTAKARDGKMLRRLEPDPTAAPVVQHIFDLYVRQRLGHGAIATELNAESIPCAAAHDPDRNRQRCGEQWDTSTVRAIVRNPRYTGRQMGRRTKGSEVLVDPTDVAWAYEKLYEWTGADEWLCPPSVCTSR